MPAARAAASASPSVFTARAAFQRRQLLGGARGLQRGDHLVEIAVDDRLQPVGVRLMRWSVSRPCGKL